LAPVPLKLTICATPSIASVAVRFPVAAGVNVTVTVQLPAAAKLVPQLLVLLNSVEFAPLIVIDVEVSGSAAFPLLVNVTGRPALDDPTFWLPNVRVVGESWPFGPDGGAFSMAMIWPFRWMYSLESLRLWLSVSETVVRSNKESKVDLVGSVMSSDPFVLVVRHLD
jgi:hypothetical protein